MDQTLWCDTVITEGINVGFVIYTGQETRVALNAKKGESHKGVLDKTADSWVMMCFCGILVTCVMLAVFARHPGILEGLAQGQFGSGKQVDLSTQFNAAAYDPSKFSRPQDPYYG